MGYNVHLGSTGCVSDGATSAPTATCTFSNTPRICLAGFDSSSQTVGIQLDALLQDADISVNTPDTPPGCMSGNFDPECITILPKLGIDFQFDDGANPAVSYPAEQTQSVFIAF